jgi:hypothetical protein
MYHYLCLRNQLLTHTKKILTMNFITPTKESPIFTATCNWFGHLDGIYKETRVEIGDCTSRMPTFALTFADAVSSLLEYAKEEKSYLLSEKNTKLIIELVDGTANADGEVKFKKVFTLTPSQIRLL